MSSEEGRMAGARSWPRLCDTPRAARFGVFCLVLTLLGGYIVSGVLLKWSYEDFDGRAGLAMDDIIGAYHGLNTRAPMLVALESGHPEELAPEDRTRLIDWLSGDRMAETYDDLALGEFAPAEIIAASCVSCHARGASDAVAAALPLEYWDDVQAVSVSREVVAKPRLVRAKSTHAHAPSMAMVLLVLGGLALMTRAPRMVIGVMLAAGGAGLLVDMAGQWLAELSSVWAWGIVVGGGVYNVTAGVLGAVVLLDLLVPRPRSA